MKKRASISTLKLHWLDFIFILFLMIGVAVVFLFFRRESSLVKARFKVTDNNPLYAEHNPRNEFAHAFKPGIVEKDELGNITAQLVNVDAYAITKEEQVVYLDIEIKALYNPKKNQYTMKGRPLIFGQPFTFNFDTVKVEAILVEPPGLKTSQKPEKEKTIITAQLRWEERSFSDTYGVSPFVAEKIKVGDEIKNTQGETVVKVLNVTVTPAKRWVVSGDGQQLINDQYLKDVFYTLEINTLKVNDRLYVFDYIPLLVGETIPLNFADISVFPTITEIVR